MTEGGVSMFECRGRIAKTDASLVEQIQVLAVVDHPEVHLGQLHVSAFAGAAHRDGQFVDALLYDRVVIEPKLRENLRRNPGPHDR